MVLGNYSPGTTVLGFFMQHLVAQRLFIGGLPRQ